MEIGKFAAVNQTLTTDLNLFQQSGSELVYTNTLHSAKTLSVVRRKPILVLPLACRIPSVQVKQPHYQLTVPTEEETFGVLRVWVEVYQPGEGPMSDFTGRAAFRANNAPVRVRRDTTQRHEYLDLHVLSNCSLPRAEMITRCVKCASSEYTDCTPLIEQGLVIADLMPSKGHRLQIKHY